MIDRQRMFDYLDGVADGLNESRNDVADVLDKIRDEVKKTPRWKISQEEVLQIIDKYRGDKE